MAAVRGGRVRTGRLLVAGLVGALLVAPAAPAAGDAGVFAGSARHVGTSAGVQQFTSRNWDGYVTVGPTPGATDFNDISATWVQPVVTCEAAQAWTVFWVGLDGWFDGTVEQGGTSAECGAKGAQPAYTLWWEMFPTNAIQSVATIHAGDTVTASVRYSTTTGVFTISVRDITSGQHFTKQARCASNLTCERSTTDVITEDVGHFGANSYFPLANYGTMTYTKAAVQDVSGHSGSLSGSNWRDGAVVEASGGTTYATVTPLSSRGQSFSAIWKHA